MKVKLGDLSSGTHFKWNGRTFEKRGYTSPIYIDPYDGKWKPWKEGCDDKHETKTSGVSCAPLLGGRFQYSHDLNQWLPIAEEVEVSW